MTNELAQLTAIFFLFSELLLYLRALSQDPQIVWILPSKNGEFCGCDIDSMVALPLLTGLLSYSCICNQVPVEPRGVEGLDTI